MYIKKITFKTKIKFFRDLGRICQGSEWGVWGFGQRTLFKWSIKKRSFFDSRETRFPPPSPYSLRESSFHKIIIFEIILGTVIPLVVMKVKITTKMGILEDYF